MKFNFKEFLEKHNSLFKTGSIAVLAFCLTAITLMVISNDNDYIIALVFISTAITIATNIPRFSETQENGKLAAYATGSALGLILAFLYVVKLKYIFAGTILSEDQIGNLVSALCFIIILIADLIKEQI